ncbi:L-threonylcarbamoyladenylate synthase [Halochromatium glycolicum]|uniref:Threonylcarbamoyl-AMP synthase n=1 Tax=Halochromatium glycolicum TaxID=85075 RepID=A0AAJ0U8J2_9GAMM|nr:L-threonylcarbamoyladenylate synthase [Halochromatium glycolicum]MBK1707309.1 threonylcarbamoyl-AMP synthase [Halochromatium glycolicum]
MPRSPLNAPADADARLSEAVDVLSAGGVVAIPTETVYGLGADAENPAAVRHIFAIKGRPANHPLIVHLAGADRVGDWSPQPSAAAMALAERFWPGPLTLVLPRAERVPDAVTGGQDTVALRAPDHPLTLALLERFGGGIAAPSANRFGRISPTTAQHVRDDLGAAVDLVLDGGPCRIGLESTIVALIGPRPQLLRPGAIGPEALSEVIGKPVDPPLKHAGASEAAVRTPGALAAHYAPRAPLELIPADALTGRLSKLLDHGERPACLGLGERPSLPAEIPFALLPADAAGYGAGLYAALRALDAARPDRILLVAPPAGADWLAVNDRLRRAAHGSGR